MEADHARSTRPRLEGTSTSSTAQRQRNVARTRNLYQRSQQGRSEYPYQTRTRGTGSRTRRWSRCAGCETTNREVVQGPKATERKAASALRHSHECGPRQRLESAQGHRDDDNHVECTTASTTPPRTCRCLQADGRNDPEITSFIGENAHTQRE